MCDDDMETYAKVNHRAWSNDVYVLRGLIAFFGGYTWLQDISTRRVEAYKANRITSVKPASVNRELGVLKHMLNVAVEWGYLCENPARPVKKLRENNARLRYLTKGEIDRLVAAAYSDLKPIITMAVNTGMRRGEIFDLKWEHIDLRNRVLEVVDPKNGDKRALPINKTLLEVLHRLPRRLDTPYVFPGKNGGRLTDIKKGFLTARKTAGLDDVTLHTCRHTFASHLVMAGVDLMTVKELLGHKSIKMTERYSHLSPHHKANAVKVLDNLSDDEAQEQNSEI